MEAWKSGKKIIVIPSLILAPLALPVLELVAKFSLLDRSVNILAQAKQFVGNLFAIYLASGPRPHEITGGNILFNQIPANIFTPNFLTQFMWWLPVLVLVAFIFVFLGIKQNWKDMAYRFILSSFVVLITSYFLSFYLLSGEHLFSRRLDATLAILFLILFFYGLNNFKYSNYYLLIILSLAITGSYTLGPDTLTVSSNQLEAVSYVWSLEKNIDKRCVLGDTYPLLALEAVSQKEIIGGNFPIDANFGQPERVEFYKQMNIAINDNLLRATASTTKADHCWFVGETSNFSKQGILSNGIYKVFGDVAVVRYNTKY
jgi:hypothetical protein